MTNIEKFNETVSILVKAYLDDTLIHDNCYACAVGNIIAAKNNYKFVDGKRQLCWENYRDIYDSPFNDHSIWTKVFFTGCDGKQLIRPSNYSGEVKAQIDSTGYTWQQLSLIEKAFEKNKQSMFNGLMAVVDVLADIHQIDLSVKEQAKQLFVK